MNNSNTKGREEIVERSGERKREKKDDSKTDMSNSKTKRIEEKIERSGERKRKKCYRDSSKKSKHLFNRDEK